MLLEEGATLWDLLAAAAQNAGHYRECRAKQAALSEWVKEQGK